MATEVSLFGRLVNLNAAGATPFFFKAGQRGWYRIRFTGLSEESIKVEIYNENRVPQASWVSRWQTDIGAPLTAAPAATGGIARLDGAGALTFLAGGASVPYRHIEVWLDVDWIVAWQGALVPGNATAEVYQLGLVRADERCSAGG